MADLNRDQYVGLILDALSGLESGGNYEAKSPQNAYGKYITDAVSVSEYWRNIAL